MAARRQALRLAARALEQRLNADTGDPVGPELPCPCGGSAPYHGRHQKTFQSALGPQRLQRAYYHGERCRSGFCPRDRALGLELSSLTPGVLRMTASAAALVSFEESSGLLHELAGVEVSAQLARFRVHPHLGGAQGPKRAFLLTADSRQPPALPRLVFVEDGYGTSATAKPERMADPLVRRSPVEPIAR
jgi:hypothetical protein